MKGFRKIHVVLAAAGALVLMLVFQAWAVAPGPRVSEDKNKHNLSSAVYNEAQIQSGAPMPNPSTLTRASRDSSIKYKATYDLVNNPQGRQVCIFCHTPHNANNTTEQTPLWNRKFSTQTFSRYSSATLQIRVNPAISSPAQYAAGAQPDGSSKLCLSCHDGVSQLGDVVRSGSINGAPIAMDAAYGNVISSNTAISLASFKPSTNKMKTGHHPVSFVYRGSIQQAISSARLTGGFKLPTAVPQVKLDKNNKMQCTTCHDPHQNQSDDGSCYDSGNGNAIVPCGSTATATRKVAPFWVLHSGSNSASSDHDAVCTSCHSMSISPAAPSWP